MRALQSNRSNRAVSPLLGGGRNWLSRFDNMFNDMEINLLGGNLWPESGIEEMVEFTPTVDIEENEEMYLVSADLPGIKKEDIKIDITGNRVRISGERSKEIKGDGYYERSQGRFSRSLTLPEDIEAKKVEANFEDGVLRVVLPKIEVKASQQVKIQSGQPQGLMDRFLHRDKNAKPSQTQGKH